jgi:hypothetical protein
LPGHGEVALRPKLLVEQREQALDRAGLVSASRKVQIVFASGTGSPSPRPRNRMQVSRSRK